MLALLETIPPFLNKVGCPSLTTTLLPPYFFFIKLNGHLFIVEPARTGVFDGPAVNALKRFGFLADGSK